MNRSLLASWYAALAALIAGGFFVWLQKTGLDRNFLLASGWTALGLMVIVTLYSLRKYLHKLGISPETRNPPSPANLERAESRMNELRLNILKGILTTKSDVSKIADRILKEEGVGKIVRIEVENGKPGGPAFVLSVLPTEPFGRVAKWLHMHLYLGLASGFLVLLHGGGSFDSPLGAAMNGLTAIVIVTGVIGTFLFALGPTWLTRYEKDLSFEEAFVLDQSLKGKIEIAYQPLSLETKAAFQSLGNSRGDFAQKASQTLVATLEREPAAKSAIQDAAVLVGQRHRIRESLAMLSRIKFWMNAWRALHVPASILLLALVFVHVLSIWWY